ncbi:MAG: hypothetical protein LBH28_03880 [Oscillospiraceae bacterium]|nr:hypothetical protein [Oscillospiraceae bacterium]
MGGESQQIIQEVVEKTGSELILFFALVIVALVVVFVPMYALIRKDRRERAADALEQKKQDMERERSIIGVVKDNTGAITGLNTLLEVSQAAAENSRGELKHSFRRVDERLHATIEKLAGYCASCAEQGENIRRIIAEIEKIKSPAQKPGLQNDWGQGYD